MGFIPIFLLPNDSHYLPLTGRELPGHSQILPLQPYSPRKLQPGLPVFTSTSKFYQFSQELQIAAAGNFCKNIKQLGSWENFSIFKSSWKSCKFPLKFDRKYLLTFSKKYDIINYKIKKEKRKREVNYGNFQKSTQRNGKIPVYGNARQDAV